jgi:hypothetical protein
MRTPPRKTSWMDGFNSHNNVLITNMNEQQRDQPKNEITAVTLQWTTALDATLKAAGLDYTWEKGRNNLAGRMTVRPEGAPTDSPTYYHIDFERKLVIREGERIITVCLEVYNPTGNLYVHILKLTPENVAKITNYARRTLDAEIARARQEVARTMRSHKARDLYQKEFGSFEFPLWAVALLNIDKDEDLSTYNVSLREHRSDFPLRRLSAEQVKALIRFIQAGCKATVAPALPALRPEFPPNRTLRESLPESEPIL